MEAMKITRFPEEFKKVAEDLAYAYEVNYHGCSQAVIAPFVELLGIGNHVVTMAASCFAGGCTRCLTCGALSGGLVVLGMKYGRRNIEDGVKPLQDSFQVGCELVDRFKEVYGTTNCCDLLGRDLSDPVQVEVFMSSPEEQKKCFERVKKVAGWVAEIITLRDQVTHS